LLLCLFKDESWLAVSLPNTYVIAMALARAKMKEDG